ncbi:hypothetical protein BU24DRAFT_432801 [Aaosphaeria arxii CBS 175.79]|uniref:Uncharacterized protein n=1 Tax=Aaosphaeria arxii CBS 175.79 TaxID=1450172 RepID=A0A6A5Y0G7_9PLEO|nr:uncharacterized protein BU24DRAFT_432801 [Aaosphaeria arxii CBS 175.79]KAF2018421.1 hypothetical protein BU24DRAFT_432801 [Aaosphaeria arxii CBS 175.79]
MTSGTVSSLFVLFFSAKALAQIRTPNAQFNQVLNINGDMELNSFTFPDRSTVETFSQKQQQLIVNQQTPAIPPDQVTGTTGQPFVAMSQLSLSINTNGATDLVGGQVEMPIDQALLQQNAVNPDNLYVAMLSPDRQTWIIQETMRSVNISDMSVRMVKRTSLDGEYMALGRQTVETNTLVVPFGSDQANTVVIQGTGLQENEFQDGFRMSVRATQPVSMNVDVKDGVDRGMLTALQGQEPINDFRYSVTTSLAAVQPDLNRMATVIQMPINAVRIQQMMQQMGVQGNQQVALSVAQRGVLQNPGGATGQLQGVGQPAGRLARDISEHRANVARQIQQGTPIQQQNPAATQLLLAPTFTPIQAQAVIDPINMRIAIPVNQVDGEFILMMQTAEAARGAQSVTPIAPGQQQQQPPAAEGQIPAAAQPETPQATESAAAVETARPEGGAQPAETATPRPAGEAAAAVPEGEAKASPTGAEEATRPSASAAASEGKPERRQESKEENTAPTGAILLSMNEVDKMVELEQWGRQAPISKMMEDYKKSQGVTSNTTLTA